MNINTTDDVVPLLGRGWRGGSLVAFGQNDVAILPVTIITESLFPQQWWREPAAAVRFLGAAGLMEGCCVP